MRRFGADYVEPTYALMCEDPLDEDTKQYEMINTVCEVTGAMPSHRLINLTHKLGGAWSQHYVPKRNTIIPNAAIYNELKNDEDRRKSKNVA